MSCKSCGSATVTTFVAEVNIHFSPSPPKNLDKPGVLACVSYVVVGAGAREVRRWQLDLNRPPGHGATVPPPGVDEPVERGHEDVQLPVPVEVGEHRRRPVAT